MFLAKTETRSSGAFGGLGIRSGLTSLGLEGLKLRDLGLGQGC